MEHFIPQGVVLPMEKHVFHFVGVFLGSRKVHFKHLKMF